MAPKNFHSTRKGDVYLSDRLFTTTKGEIVRNYYEEKKRKGFIFTLHNLGENYPYSCIAPNTLDRLIDPPHEYWSRLSGRYRTAEEQRVYIVSGCIDHKLPPLSGDDS